MVFLIKFDFLFVANNIIELEYRKNNGIYT